MIKVVKIAIILMINFVLLGCAHDCMKAKTEEMKSLLEIKLKIGDERERVEKVLKDAGILYTYDQFQNRFQSTITDPRCGSDQAISVYVYFDTSKKMSKVEVFESYTGL